MFFSNVKPFSSREIILCFPMAFTVEESVSLWNPLLMCAASFGSPMRLPHERILIAPQFIIAGSCELRAPGAWFTRLSRRPFDGLLRRMPVGCDTDLIASQTRAILSCLDKLVLDSECQKCYDVIGNGNGNGSGNNESKTC